METESAQTTQVAQLPGKAELLPVPSVVTGVSEVREGSQEASLEPQESSKESHHRRCTEDQHRTEDEASGGRALLGTADFGMDLPQYTNKLRLVASTSSSGNNPTSLLRVKPKGDQLGEESQSADPAESSSRQLGEIRQDSNQTADPAERSSRQLGEIRQESNQTADPAESSSRQMGEIRQESNQTADPAESTNQKVQELQRENKQLQQKVGELELQAKQLKQLEEARKELEKKNEEITELTKNQADEIHALQQQLKNIQANFDEKGRKEKAQEEQMQQLTKACKDLEQKMADVEKRQEIKAAITKISANSNGKTDVSILDLDNSNNKPVITTDIMHKLDDYNQKLTNIDTDFLLYSVPEYDLYTPVELQYLEEVPVNPEGILENNFVIAEILAAEGLAEDGEEDDELHQSQYEEEQHGALEEPFEEINDPLEEDGDQEEDAALIGVEFEPEDDDPSTALADVSVCPH